MAICSSSPRKVKEMLESFIHSPTADTDSEENQVKGPPPPSTKGLCNPRNKELFLERVKTFSSRTWAAKPIELSPLCCAQYGWENDDADHLRCVTCRATIFAGIPEDWCSSTYSDICRKIQADLKIGHDKLCPWPDNPCPQSFLSLPELTREQWRHVVQEAFDCLLCLGKNLPLLDEDVLDDMGFTDRLLMEDLLALVHQVPSTDEENLFCRTAIAMAHCGWRPSEPIVEDPSVCCSVCGQEVGLWNFIKVLSDPESTFNKDEGSQERSHALSCRSLATESLVSQSQEVMSSNVSMHSENSAQMSENGNQVEQARANLQLDLTSKVEHTTVQEDSSESTRPDTPTNSDVLSPVSKHIFTEPQPPPPGQQGLMRELLLATAPGSLTRPAQYSESILSEIGSETFERRLEISNDDLRYEHSLLTDPAPPPPPSVTQQQLMKELLFLTAPGNSSPKGSESIFSEIGSVAFDKRIEMSSISSPRACTPTPQGPSKDGARDALEFSESEFRAKRIKLQESRPCAFDILGEHRLWCPWILSCRGFLEESSENLLDAPGWRMVLYKILPSRRQRRCDSPPEEAWKSVRRLLKDCYTTSSGKS